MVAKDSGRFPSAAISDSIESPNVRPGTLRLWLCPADARQVFDLPPPNPPPRVSDPS